MAHQRGESGIWPDFLSDDLPLVIELMFLGKIIGEFGIYGTFRAICTPFHFLL
ncbi:hypothetical protein [Streptococcus hyovaginalis]|uniref:hypothetical protein n=1 Tax=Streptococcus hyovaginalis TaxID=149015 RepID=UPI0014782C15|nr:hypothetical protein [Streptococcus hyovaginalis]